MIKHIGEGLTPFEDCGFARYPTLPLVGEDVMVRCRMDGSAAVPELVVASGGHERILTAKRAGGQFFEFSLGCFSAPQKVRYQFRTDDESTPWYAFDVLRAVTLDRPKGIFTAENQLQIALDDNLTLTLKDDASITLEQIAARGEPCEKGVLGLADGYAFIAQKNFIWKLNRLSETLIEARAYTLLVDCDGQVRKVSLALFMPCEYVLGTGERFDAVNQAGRATNGRVVEKFTHQGNQTYLPMPFFMTEKGYGWYRQSAAPACMRFGKETVIAQETSGAVLTRDRLLFGKPNEILAAFSRLTGDAVLPPEWAFGVWISGNGWNTDAEVDAQLAALKRFDYPASVMVLEQWSDERTFYRWHEKNWRDPAAMVARVRKAGLHLVLWQIPVIKYEWDGSPGEALAADEREALAGGYVVKRADGSPYRITENWFHHSLLPDFTNPKAVAWWFGKRSYLLDMGVEGFKTDGGEFLFENAVRLFDGTDGLAAHNLYPVQYVGAYHRFLKENGVRGVTFSRAGYLGAQAQPIHWAGDQKSEWSELRAQLCAGLSAGLSGVIFFSFDIGGFAGPIPNAELYLRATAFGCFAPVMQWHSEPRYGQFGGGAGGNNDRSPWNLAERTGDASVLEIGCRFARLREKLRPYLWREACACVKARRPMMAHLCLDYPDDPRAYAIDDEYILGRSLLVAPVVEAGADCRTVYLPAGAWRGFFDGAEYQGPCVVTVACPLHEIPVFQKKGADL